LYKLKLKFEQIYSTKTKPEELENCSICFLNQLQLKNALMNFNDNIIDGIQYFKIYHILYNTLSCYTDYLVLLN